MHLLVGYYPRSKSSREVNHLIKHTNGMRAYYFRFDYSISCVWVSKGEKIPKFQTFYLTDWITGRSPQDESAHFANNN